MARAKGSKRSSRGRGGARGAAPASTRGNKGAAGKRKQDELDDSESHLNDDLEESLPAVLAPTELSQPRKRARPSREPVAPELDPAGNNNIQPADNAAVPTYSLRENDPHPAARFGLAKRHQADISAAAAEKRLEKEKRTSERLTEARAKVQREQEGAKALAALEAEYNLEESTANSVLRAAPLKYFSPASRSSVHKDDTRKDLDTFEPSSEDEDVAPRALV